VEIITKKAQRAAEVVIKAIRLLVLLTKKESRIMVSKRVQGLRKDSLKKQISLQTGTGAPEMKIEN
jgi:hypothetical protein